MSVIAPLPKKLWPETQELLGRRFRIEPAVQTQRAGTTSLSRVSIVVSSSTFIAREPDTRFSRCAGPRLKKISAHRDSIAHDAQEQPAGTDSALCRMPGSESIGKGWPSGYRVSLDVASQRPSKILWSAGAASGLDAGERARSSSLLLATGLAGIRLKRSGNDRRCYLLQSAAVSGPASLSTTSCGCPGLLPRDRSPGA
ncbi:MAG: hypothetical protein KatS3mg077_2244 [Candidatus Binatia bacterium]|nr:MAG: hypothetical protein KatS3mg077_2244 [Candidatus Binatia bacterium]